MDQIKSMLDRLSDLTDAEMALAGRFVQPGLPGDTVRIELFEPVPAGRNGARDGPQDGTHDDHGKAQATWQTTKQLRAAFQQVFSQATSFKNGAHEGEKRNGQQQVVAENAKNVQRQVGHEAHGEPVHADGEEATSQA